MCSLTWAHRSAVPSLVQEPGHFPVSPLLCTITTTVQAPNLTKNINFAMIPGSTLSGRVTESGGIALPGVAVGIDKIDGSYNYNTYTDATGVYTATVLPGGQYTVLFQSADHIEERYNNKQPHNHEQPDSITIPASSTVTGVDAELTRGAIIKGRVMDAKNATN